MTDRRNPGEAPPRDEASAEARADWLETRLEAWFAGEVNQASVDLARRPLGAGSRAPAGRSRGTPALPLGPAAALLVVIIAVVAGVTRLPGVVPGTEPTGPVPTGTPVTGSQQPNGSASASPVATELPSAITARSRDGIPQVIDGERVIRPGSIERLGPVDDRSFLLGGWTFDFRGFVYACPLILGTPPPFGPPRCGSQFVAEAPIIGETARVNLENWTAEIPAGPVVLRVHRYDARAATCAPEMRAACDQLAVIEAVVWTGDAVTAAAPITPIEAFQRLVGADPNLQTTTLAAAGYPPADSSATPAPTIDVSRPRAVIECTPPYPVLAWSMPAIPEDVVFQPRPGPFVETVLVFPSTADRILVEQDLTASGFRGREGCFVTFDSLFSHRWVAVENVMVAVRQSVDGPTVEEARMVADVRAALEAAP